MMYDVVRAARKRDPFGIDVKDFAGHMAPFFRKSIQSGGRSLEGPDLPLLCRRPRALNKSPSVF